MRMVRSISVLAIVAMLLASCDKPTNKSNSDGAPATAAPTGAQDDERAALLIAQFTTPIILNLNVDGYDAAAHLASLGGIDPRPTYGAVYEQNSGGCPTAISGRGLVLNSNAGAIDPALVLGWLQKEHFLEVQSFTITYSNAQMAESYGSSNTFYCLVLTPAFAPYAGTQDIHHATTVQLAQRVFDRWTFENRYEMAYPGKGSVSVFAGTFTYHFQGIAPGVSSSGTGTASVKLYRNPDNGQWTVLEYNATDPGIAFDN